MSTARAQSGPVALLLALTGAGWWATIERTKGMDADPWTGLGSSASGS